MKNVFIFLVLGLSTAPTLLHAQWLESKGAHYTVCYQAGLEDDAAFTRKRLKP